MIIEKSNPDGDNNGTVGFRYSGYAADATDYMAQAFKFQYTII